MKMALSSLKKIFCCVTVVVVGFPSKGLELQFVLIYFVVLHCTSKVLQFQFQTAFCWYTAIVHAIVDDIGLPSVFVRCITNTWG